MRARGLPAFAASLVIGGIAVALAGAVVEGVFDLVLFAFGLWGFVGALIVALLPTNSVGWLFSATGLIWATGLTASSMAESAGAGSALTVTTWYSEWFWVAGIVLMVCSLFLIPSGRPQSSGWRRVLVAYAITGLVLVFLTAFQEEIQASDRAPVVSNPIGIAGVGDAADAGLGPLLMFGGFLAALASLVVRYRSGDADERRRLKLIALAASVMVTCAVVGGIVETGPIADISWALAIAAVPVACAIAILRYQLFDVDRLISRTLVYATLTVVLGAAYVGLVLVGQALFSSFAGGSNLAIAVSTLLVAALSLPIRARVQGFVDRRFYRRRYDARRTLETFGSRLRDEVDLETLDVELRVAIDETMQPTHVTLWLREGEA